METGLLEEAIKKVKESAKGRKFTQSIDLIMVFKKKSEKEKINVDLLLHLPHRIKDIKTCAFVGDDIPSEQLKGFSKVIRVGEFKDYDKKGVRKLVKGYDFFFAEASIMPQMAAKFGKNLTNAGKMPNPKTNTIIDPRMNLPAMAESMKDAVRVASKKNLAVSVKVGDVNSEDKDIIDNINTVYEGVRSSLPDGENNISKVYLKLTMGEPVKI
ncbi:MAG: hypothetical protein OH316_01105 [Candidatus Parvarchaeota archaeon]|nr:hypothetical protein [Candidatus Parvarchaeota archaeon]